MLIKDVNVVDVNIPYGKLVNYINFVISNCFDEKTGRYHEYKRDYSLAVAIISMYTDYNGSDYPFDDVMEFIHTDRWNEIIDQLGDKYIDFVYYVDAEIDDISKPFAFANETILLARKVIGQLGDVLSVIDKEQLKGYDFSKLFEAVEQLNSASENAESVGTQNDTNVVEFKKD